MIFPFQRLLRPDHYKRGYEVGVQNYIDNTGVQVADVVVGLVHLEGKNLAATRERLAGLADGDPEWLARRVVEDLAIALQASLLLRHSPSFVAESRNFGIGCFAWAPR